MAAVEVMNGNVRARGDEDEKYLYGDSQGNIKISL